MAVREDVTESHLHSFMNYTYYSFLATEQANKTEVNVEIKMLSMVKNKTNYMQQQRFIDKSRLARHVSGNNSAHHQEH